jgi:hypothetical protein
MEYCGLVKVACEQVYRHREELADWPVTDALEMTYRRVFWRGFWTEAHKTFGYL